MLDDAFVRLGLASHYEGLALNVKRWWVARDVYAPTENTTGRDQYQRTLTTSQAAMGVNDC